MGSHYRSYVFVYMSLGEIKQVFYVKYQFHRRREEETICSLVIAKNPVYQQPNCDTDEKTTA